MSTKYFQICYMRVQAAVPRCVIPAPLAQPDLSGSSVSVRHQKITSQFGRAFLMLSTCSSVSGLSVSTSVRRLNMAINGSSELM